MKTILDSFHSITEEITTINAWASSSYGKNYLPQFAWKGTDVMGSRGFFSSVTEDNPWLRIQLNRKETITSVSIRNRLDCCGHRLENLEVRAGTKNDNTNEIVGTFAGPGVTGAKHVIQFTKPVVADFLTFQLKQNGVLQINGIYLNDMPAFGKNNFQDEYIFLLQEFFTLKIAAGDPQKKD